MCDNRLFSVFLIPETKWTHKLLVYADGVNLLGDNMDTVDKNTETLIDANKDIGLQVTNSKIMT
jgi:hypothetical protein